MPTVQTDRNGPTEPVHVWPDGTDFGVGTRVRGTGTDGMGSKGDEGGSASVPASRTASAAGPLDAFPTFPANLAEVTAFVEAGQPGANIWVDYFEEHPKLKTMNAFSLFMKVFFANAAGTPFSRRDARRHFDPLSPYQADRKIKELQEDGFIRIVKLRQETGLVLSQEVADLIVHSSQISMQNYREFFRKHGPSSEAW